MVLSDDSDIVKNLKHRQRNIFMETHKNMKCELPDSVVVKCDRFVKDFNNSSVSRIMRNEFHDKRWKESKTELVKVVERILSIL